MPPHKHKNATPTHTPPNTQDNTTDIATLMEEALKYIKVIHVQTRGRRHTLTITPGRRR